NNLFGPLAQRGKSEIPTALRLIKRTGNNKSMTLCKDICDKVIMSHKKQIDVLEAEVHNMSTILDQLLLSINVPKSPTCIESRSDTAASKPINATALHSTQNIAMKSVNCSDRSNTQVTNPPDKHDTGSKTG
ncbi:unnamed protein product, partial [Owenia fusiformis]